MGKPNKHKLEQKTKVTSPPRQYNRWQRAILNNVAKKPSRTCGFSKEINFQSPVQGLYWHFKDMFKTGCLGQHIHFKNKWNCSFFLTFLVLCNKRGPKARIQKTSSSDIRLFSSGLQFSHVGKLLLQKLVQHKELKTKLEETAMVNNLNNRLGANITS